MSNILQGHILKVMSENIEMFGLYILSKHFSSLIYFFP